MAVKLLTPILPDQMEYVMEDIGELYRYREEEEIVQNLCITNIRVVEEDFSHMRFSAVQFENCIFQDCSFENGEFSDVSFQACDFSNCDFSDSYFNRIEFVSKAVGTKFCGSTLLHTKVKDSNFNYVNFDSSKMEHIQFSDSQLQGAFITQCRCKSMEWNRVNLENTSFFKTMLKGMDFSDCTIQGILLSDDFREIKGAVVDLYQAAELAKYMGVVIKT